MTVIEILAEVQALTQEERKQLMKLMIDMLAHPDQAQAGWPREADTNAPRRKRQFGSAAGMFQINEDFDTPLADFDEYTR
jgi:hypothetical protein